MGIGGFNVRAIELHRVIVFVPCAGPRSKCGSADVARRPARARPEPGERGVGTARSVHIGAWKRERGRLYYHILDLSASGRTVPRVDCAWDCGVFRLAVVGKPAASRWPVHTYASSFRTANRQQPGPHRSPLEPAGPPPPRRARAALGCALRGLRPGLSRVALQRSQVRSLMFLCGLGRFILLSFILVVQHRLPAAAEPPPSAAVVCDYHVMRRTRLFTIELHPQTTVVRCSC